MGPSRSCPARNLPIQWSIGTTADIYLETDMKVVKVLLATVLGVIAVVMAWNLVTGIIGTLMSLVTTIFWIAISVAVIGGLGWAIMRLLGRKSLTGSKTQFLP